MTTFLNLNCCVQHFNNLNLKTNPTKSEFINFRLRSADFDRAPAVMLADTMLEEVCTTKFLGIYLDRGLTWKDHINSVCSKLASGVFVLRSLSRFCPTQILMTAYYGLIYPHLTYGVVVWGSSANSELLRVFRLQKKAVRIVAKLRKRESCKPAFKQLKLLTLPSIYILETVLFCTSKCDLTRGSDIHHHNTRGRENYRTGHHRTVVYEHLPSQAGVTLINSLPNNIKNAPVPKALKARLRNFLSSQAFYSVSEYLAHDWETD